MTLEKPSSLFGMCVLASITFTFMAGANAPTPLYNVYQAAWGFSTTTLGAIFAAYVLFLMLSLLILGRLSDHVGRLPVIFTATALQIGAMVVFATASGVEALVAARLLQGLASGAALAAVGTALLDIDREVGAIANALAPPLGSAAGGLLSGVMVHFLPYPTVLIYLGLGGLYALQVIALFAVRETSPMRPGAARSLVPTLVVSADAMVAMRRAAPILVAVWAIAGFYSSLVPSLAEQVFSVNASLGGGFAVFLLSLVGGIAVLALRRLVPRRLVQMGSLILVASMLGVIGSMYLRSTALFWVATVLAGIAFGAGFQGGLRTALQGAGTAERSSVLSLAFIVSYVSMGLPAVIVGWSVQHFGDLARTAYAFSAAVVALALCGFLSSRLDTNSQGSARR